MSEPGLGPAESGLHGSFDDAKGSGGVLDAHAFNYAKGQNVPICRAQPDKRLFQGCRFSVLFRRLDERVSRVRTIDRRG